MQCTGPRPTTDIQSGFAALGIEMTLDKEKAIHELWLISDDAANIIKGVSSVIKDCAYSNEVLSEEKLSMIIFALDRVANELSKSAELAECHARISSKS